MLFSLISLIILQSSRHVTFKSSCGPRTRNSSQLNNGRWLVLRVGKTIISELKKKKKKQTTHWSLISEDAPHTHTHTPVSLCFSTAESKHQTEQKWWSTLFPQSQIKTNELHMPIHIDYHIVNACDRFFLLSLTRVLWFNIYIFFFFFLLIRAFRPEKQEAYWHNRYNTLTFPLYFQCAELIGWIKPCQTLPATTDQPTSNHRDLRMIK